MIGRPFLPPYWSLGFQLSRWGYNRIETVKNLVKSMRQYDIPQVFRFNIQMNSYCQHRNWVGEGEVSRSCLSTSTSGGQYRISTYNNCHFVIFHYDGDDDDDDDDDDNANNNNSL